LYNAASVVIISNISLASGCSERWFERVIAGLLCEREVEVFIRARKNQGVFEVGWM
jgi:hypothetical protein